MPPLSLAQLYQSYMQLRDRLQRQVITYQQFVDGVRQLRAQDAAGRWWMIDPQSGQYLTYTANGWVPATPEADQSRPTQTAAEAAPVQAVARPHPQASAQTEAAPQIQRDTRRQGGCLTSPILTGLFSFGAAGLWLVYTSLRGRREGFDILTPLLIAGTPFLIRLLQKPLDRILNPLYKAINIVPRPLLVGAAFAVPLVLGGILTNGSASGYGALRRSTFFSVILAYVLTRRPEARS